MDTQPFWKDSPYRSSYAPLNRDLQVDVLIIGGGITGVSAAHLIRQRGFSVALVERDSLGDGDTSHTTAHLTYMTDTRLSELIKVCGKEKAEIAWRAGKAAIEHIRATAEDLNVNVAIQTVPGYLAASTRQDVEAERKELEDEAEIAYEMGFEVAMVDRVPPTGTPGIRFEGQMKFHPLRYLFALARAAASEGVEIFEGTNVSEFGEEPLHVIANGHRITFGKVVIATHVPLQGMRGTVGAALFQTKLASYSTYAIAATVPKGCVPEMIWSYTEDPFHYLRMEPGETEDCVIFGGADHKTGQEADTAACYDRLERDLAEMVPVSAVTHRWSGQVVEAVDGLPYIGESTEGQFVATGFSGNGMTFGVVAALMAADWAQGTENAWESTFAPSRVEIAALPTYLAENKDYPYHMVKDRMGIPPDAVPKTGEGVVTDIDGEHVATFLDENGKTHRVSAVCPHMGGIVVWNSAEKTWDCPCHGSRFTECGALISGPAETGLQPIKEVSPE